MYYYTGKDLETGEKIEREFEDHDEARNFADEYSREYPVYKIYDDEMEGVIYSNEIDDDANAVARENMFPEGEDNED